MVSRLVQWRFKGQVQGMIKRLISEKRLVFLNENTVRYTDRDNETSDLTFTQFANHIVTTLVTTMGNNKTANSIASSVGLNALSAMSGIGISDETVVEVLKEKYKEVRK